MPADIKHLGFIDALRGYAILGVIGVHASLFVPELEWPLRLLADQGARGVQLFFVVSALTLMLSWHNRADGALPFYIRRVFRIAPMFWLAIVFCVAIAGSPLSWAPVATSWPHLLAAATFVYGFHPDSINSVVPGGWSVADEMAFYVMFPLLASTLRSWRAAAAMFAASACFAMLTYLLLVQGSASLALGLDRAAVAQFAFFWFLNQLPVFIIGIVVFHLLQAFSGKLPQGAVRAGLVVSLVTMVVIPFAINALPPHYRFVLYFTHLGYAASFGLCAFCLAQGIGRALVAAPIRYIGKVSYSAYFCHFPVLMLISNFGIYPFHLSDVAPGWLRFIAMFAGAATLTMAVATLTFRLVERPMIHVGAQVAAKAVRKEPVLAEG
jgi:exopolysaccharide production protein ExoZ